ncbi:MAG TPA: segregation/condensation protein A [Pirellulales bacterium]|jgi:segregation and condensation protein A|nr:segregation/condensation protein A [Pirellulales bacterium]
MTFRVALDVYRGPLDLLLYLVRKHEVDIQDLPIALVAEQFLAHLAVLEELDINAVGEFIEMASTLAEIKSRMILPHSEEEEAAVDDPRRELVQQLIEYKRFKDAGSRLEERGRAWQQRFPRLVGDAAPSEIDPAQQPLRDVELWDLVSVFGTIMRSHEAAPSASIVYDDTPLHVFTARIRERLAPGKPVPLGDLFQPGMHKSTLVGIVLAILELIRDHAISAEQRTLFGEIWLLPSGEAVAEST